MRPIKALYCIKKCPSDDSEQLENILNEMSNEGWELYTLHEVDGELGYCYNCIFVRDASEDAKSDESDEVLGFKTRMERILTQDNNPFQKCQDVQKKIKQVRGKIDKIKSMLEDASSGEHDKLNAQMSNLMFDLNQLKKQLREIISPDYVVDSIGEEKLAIALSEEILDLVNPDSDAGLISQTVRIRQKLVDELGYVIPSIKFVDDETLQANEFSIKVRGNRAFSASVYPGYLMFYTDELTLDKLPKNSFKDVDAISGREIVWIKKEATKDFWVKGLAPEEFIARALEFVCIKNVDEIFDYGDLNRYIEIVGSKNVYLIENIIPEFVSLAELKYLLTNLIKEKVSIKDIVYVFEKINDFSDESAKDDLLDKIRVSLAKQISAKLADENSLISAIQLSAETIDGIINLIENNEQTIVRVDGAKLKKIINKVLKVCEKLDLMREKVILIAPLEVRHMISMVISQLAPVIQVVAEEEISNDYALEILATI